MNAANLDWTLPSLMLPRITPMLARCLLLAALLHVWLLLLLGNVPGGTAREGREVWGAIDVTLRGDAAPESPTAARQPEALRPGGPLSIAPSVAERTLPKAGTPGRQPALDAIPQAPAVVPSPAPVAPPSVAPLLSNPTADAGWLAESAPIVPPSPIPARVIEQRLQPSTFSAVSPLAATPPLLAPALPSPTASVLLAVPTPDPVVPPAATAVAVESASPLQRLPVTAPAPADAAVAAGVASLQRDPANVTLSVPPDAGGGADLPTLGAPPRSLPTGGVPGAETRVGQDSATPAAALPRLNLELPRSRSAVLSRQATQGVLPLLPLPPQAPNKLARDIESAAKADCRTAHTGLGILAVVPLVVDGLRKDGCRW